MSSINHISITGNIARKPELRATATGNKVLSFTVAVDEARKQADGTYADYASFIDCTLFGNRAEALADIVGQGDKVAVQGRLHQSRWDAEDGKRSKLEVIASDVDLMQRKGA